LAPLIAYVEANEQDTITYELSRQTNIETGKEDLVFEEVLVAYHTAIENELSLMSHQSTDIRMRQH
jgi:hypothetical protein